MKPPATIPIGLATLWVCVAIASRLAADAPSDNARHVTVYHAEGRFAGWPATHGIWVWGDEILVGFSVGTYLERGTRHHMDPDAPVEHCLARSLNGGETWAVEYPNRKGLGQLIPEGTSLHGKTLPNIAIPPWTTFDGSIDFNHPDVALTFRLNNNHRGPSRFYYSLDRGHDWHGPFRIPAMGTHGIAARTDYVVQTSEECLVFLTSAKSNYGEGRPFCALLQDGGRRWTFRSWIGDEPDGFAIMPSAVRTRAGTLVVVVRRRKGAERRLDAYESRDDGHTWHPLPSPVLDLGQGNPGHLIVLQDGRLCLTYGVRKPPFRIAAKLSADNGHTWSKERILRDDGTSPDIGYTQSAQCPDGTIVTTYYISEPSTGPERTIAATLWQAP